MKIAVKYIDTTKYLVRVSQELDPMNPREWDNLGIMACFHNRYELGDKHEFETPEQLTKFVSKFKGIALPLYLIDHSGISMRTRDFSDIDPEGWDSGQVGYIYVSDRIIVKEYGKGQQAYDKARKYLQGEVKDYDDYLTGNLYYVDITAHGGQEVDNASSLPYDAIDDFIKDTIGDAEHEVIYET